MSITIDFTECPNCGIKKVDRETNNRTGHVQIYCNVCGFDSDHRENVCPKCTSGLSYDTIEDNGILDPMGNFAVQYKTKCCNEKCDYEGFSIYKMEFVHHSDTPLER